MTSRIRHATGRRPCARLLPFLLTLVVGGAACAGEPVQGGPDAAGRRVLRDAPPVWYADDMRPIPVPEFAEQGLVPYAFNGFVARPFSRFFHPGRLGRTIDDGYPGRPAVDVNALDEVVDSSWFTNRIGLRPLADDELVLGPAHGTPYGEGPDRSAPWRVVGAKVGGVTPGFRIRDARGDTWLLKFDPPSHPGMTIRSGVVANLIFHAMGFHTPVDRVVSFTRDDLVVEDGVAFSLGRGETLALTPANMDSVLAATRSVFGGEYHALASRYLDGIPLGPFDEEGTRPDDPNDVIHHQDRRELRALKVFAGWLNHFDIKSQNSLDMYVGAPGEGYVKHHLIDFASTLGSYGDEAVKRFGYEYGIDVFPVLGRTFTFGLVEDYWYGIERPEGLDEVGLFDVEHFRPAQWKPDLGHSAIANLARDDGYWAAKIVGSFSDRQLRLLVEQGRYQDPRAVDYLVATLAGRRDRIVRHWFAEVPPLDWFRPVAGGIGFDDLAVVFGCARESKARYRYRVRAVAADRDGGDWSGWRETRERVFAVADDAALTDAARPFLAVEFQIDRGQGWSRAARVYQAPASGRIVGVER
jgi:hypothetical protein